MQSTVDARIRRVSCAGRDRHASDIAKPRLGNTRAISPSSIDRANLAQRQCGFLALCCYCLRGLITALDYSFQQDDEVPGDGGASSRFLCTPWNSCSAAPLSVAFS